jgi:hypothetical protein
VITVGEEFDIIEFYHVFHNLIMEADMQTNEGVHLSEGTLCKKEGAFKEPPHIPHHEYH